MKSCSFSIMKSVIKHHSGSVKTIAPYIASSIVSIFVKNPKTLSVGYKVSALINQIQLLT